MTNMIIFSSQCLFQIITVIISIITVIISISSSFYNALNNPFLEKPFLAHP